MTDIYDEVKIGRGTALYCDRHEMDPFYTSQGKPTPGMHIIVPTGATVTNIMRLVDEHEREWHTLKAV